MMMIIAIYVPAQSKSSFSSASAAAEVLAYLQQLFAIKIVHLRVFQVDRGLIESLVVWVDRIIRNCDVVGLLLFLDLCQVESAV